MKSDADLVQETLLGRRSAFDTLVRRWSARACGYATAKVRHPQVAEELVQEAFLRSYRGLARLDQPEKFGAWFISIVHRLCLDWIKNRKRTEVNLEESESPTDAHSPEAEAQELEEKNKLLIEVESLPDDLREVIMVFYFGNSTYQQIADTLGVSVATVNCRLAKARKMLRERLLARETK